MKRACRGIALVAVLVWLMAVSLLAVSAMQVGLQDQKASRSYRDQEVAFQAAEAGLRDAEMDIEASPDPARSRSALFDRHRATGFPADSDSPCQRGERNPLQGLCRQSGDALPTWLQQDLAAPDNDATVSYGRFTGHTMQTGVGALPARLPRYLIELLRYRQAGQTAERPEYFYRITAIGFGAEVASQVVLQTFYRKGSPS